jgi:hypothetical protein
MSERIKQLAKEAGLEFTYDPTETPMRVFVEAWGEDLEKFAALIRADEREACAKLCAEDGVQAMDFTGGTFVGGYFAKKIIARGDS